jgi:hypothetical protein
MKSKNKIFTTTFTILLFIVIFIFCIILLFLLPLLKFRPWYRWWNTYDPDNKYNCFKISSLAYFESNTILYNISNLFIQPRQKFVYNWWVYFITGFMKGGAKGIVPDGWVVPKHFCDSLVPDSPPINMKDWPVFAADWRPVIKSWGNITFDQGKYVADTVAWAAEPDNFLWKDWGIPPDSGLIVGFITGYSTSPLPGNETLWPDLIEPLLGIRTGIASGGWFGFLQNNDNFAGRGLDEANRLIWADQRPQKLIQKGIKSKCNGYGVAEGAVTTGIGGSFVGGMVGSGVAAATGAEAGAAFGPIGILIGLIGGAITGAVLSAGNEGCF